jgi:hypothetical protein
MTVKAINAEGVANTTKMATENQIDLDVSPVDPSALAWAEYWYPIAWKGLIVFGVVTALAACGTIAFLLLQWRATSIREEHGEWRTAALEVKASVFNKAAADAQKDIARLTVEAEALRTQTAEAQLAARKIEEKLLVPRWLSGEQQGAIRSKLSEFPGTVAHIWIYPAGTADSFNFAHLLEAVLQHSNWVTASWTVQTGFPSLGGVLVRWRDGNETARNAAHALVNGLKNSGVGAVVGGTFDRDGESMGPQIPAVPVNNNVAATPPAIIIWVGTKTGELR